MKKFESGIIRDPITIAPDRTVADLIELTMEHKISGVPVVEGRRAGRHHHQPRRALRTAHGCEDPRGHDPEGEAGDCQRRRQLRRDHRLLHRHRIEKVLLVNDAFELKGMVTVKDINKAKAFPNSCKDAHGSLRVGAGVGTGAETEERISALVEAGVDVLVVDTAHGHSSRVLERIRWVRRHYPDVGLIAGNVATRDGAEALIEVGRRRHQGGYRAGLHLHHPGRHRHRRAADHRHLGSGIGRRSGRHPASSPTAASAIPATSRRPSSRARAR